MNNTINLNVSDFLSERSKYVLKKLDSQDVDYKFIKNSFVKSVGRQPEIKDFVVYRVNCQHSEDANFSSGLLFKTWFQL